MILYHLFLFSSLIAVFTSSVLALYPPHDYFLEYTYTGSLLLNNSNPIDEPVSNPLKFNDWYEQFSDTLTEISTTVCNLSLKAYQGDIEARIALGPIRDYCSAHANCIQSTISERLKASFAATSILLGFAPTMLSLIGPSVGEVALLSLYRPFLSALLSLGIPAVFPGRFLFWEDPLRAYEPQTGSFVVPPLSRKWTITVSVAQYALAAIACANNFHAAYRTGVGGVSTWSCKTWYWPTVWIVITLGIHVISSVSLRLAITRKKIERGEDLGDVSERERWKRSGLLPILYNELTLSANRAWHVSDLYDVKLGPAAVALQYLGVFASVWHLVFGTLLFSSLLFIGLEEASFLILRFVASAFFCRLLIQFEIGGMIKVEQHRLYRGIVQPSERGR